MQKFIAYAKKALLLLRCGAYFIFRKRDDRLPHKIEKILVIQLSQLGDMVCTTPMFKAIKTAYPSAKLLVLGKRYFRELVNLNPDIDEYVSKMAINDMINRLKSERIDFACLTSPDFNSLAVAYLAGIPAISCPIIEGGFSPAETISYCILRKAAIKIPYVMGQYAPRQYLRLLEPVGITSEDTTKHLYFTPESENKIREFMSNRGIHESDCLVGISPGVGNKIKLWRPERFARIADYIHKAYNAKVVIMGGPTDAEEVIQTANLAQDKESLIIANGIFSLDELKAFISKLRLYISVDTGPIYICEALGVPTVDITGPFNEREQAPIGDLHAVVVPPTRTKPAISIMNASLYDEIEARRQIDSITVEMVKKAIDDIMHKLNISRRSI